MSHRSIRALPLLALSLLLAACGNAAAPSPTPPAASATIQPTPTAVPGDPGGGTGGGGTGGGGSDPGSGTGGGGLIPFPPDPNQDPLFGNATYVTPVGGLINPHPINVQLVRALQQEDGTVVVDLRWWSGVAPCTQLDHVEISQQRGSNAIRFTVVEGSGVGDVACIDIAQLSATTVDLGSLAAGTWTLSAEGDAPAITLEVR